MGAVLREIANRVGGGTGERGSPAAGIRRSPRLHPSCRNCMELPPIGPCNRAGCLKIQAGYRAPWLWAAPEPCSRRMD